jgi:DNA-binding PadR family transcriptional regulator
MNNDMPWVNLTQKEINELRDKKFELTEYGKDKLRELMNNQEPYPDAMFEEAERRERANELYQDALHELDYIAAGGQDMEEFMNSYLVIQTALKVALGEEDV